MRPSVAVAGSLDKIPEISARGAVGLIDSGAGGLSVLRAISECLPSEPVLYCADVRYAPYGDKPVEVIEKRILTLADFLLSQGAKAIVLACNTATGAAVRVLRDRVQIPVVAVEPAIKPAATLTKVGKVGVLATSNTLQGNNVKRLIAQFGQQVTFHLQACPGLMEQVEKGAVNHDDTRQMLQHWLAPMLQAGVDCIVLGCTHYPWLSDMIRSIVGQEVALIDPAPAVAKQLQRLLQGRDLLTSNNDQPAYRFFSSAPSAQQADVYRQLLGYALQIDEIPAQYV